MESYARTARQTRTRWLALGACVLAAVVVVGVMQFVKLPNPSNVAVYPAGDSGMDALLTGTVEITTACVTVHNGAETWTPVFPRGSTTMAGDTLVFRGGEFVSGDPIELGGGEAVTRGDATIPSGCPHGQLWMVAPG
ncbi:dihydrolipoamide dehydrogenase [Janibacter sp. HTCC2649]|uniref:hypothetical protein n=1 Tax=Janibacter sp. HTCC2649 TaxID=313589 RepID=UPI0000670512|nr:hypothetical protein [Janibacter sp. HTCC2649]EAP96896.1 hypothetical protein JNB_00015 [Janibacter sp. HTCC2649]EAP96901.1 hypothetical protein JNB_00040 [Janibacter sp. HTCC2649]EAP99625.1 dihydrolipoamide dehydrogenase [Janibacter sp. HTCC2649]